MRVQQQSCVLLSLIKDVATGHLLPASMQRPYVWTSQDVEALCDSILSGFPIGGFLLWTPGRHADLGQVAHGRLGPLLVQDKKRETSLLLDGQNRLATLAWMMARETPISLENSGTAQDFSAHERDTWLSGNILVLDNASRSVKFVPAEEADCGLRLPAWTLVESSALGNGHRTAYQLIRSLCNQWSKSFTESEIDDFLKFFDHCCDRFRDAQVVVTVLENATAQEARHAFLRICRVGVPMSVEDFDRAIQWSAETENEPVSGPR